MTNSDIKVLRVSYFSVVHVPVIGTDKSHTSEHYCCTHREEILIIFEKM